MNLIAQQVRAARGLLGWSQGELAARTRLSVRTIKRVEAGEELTPAADLSIRRTLEAEGVAFFATTEELAGKHFVGGVALLRA